MTILALTALLAPLVAAALTGVVGWRPVTAATTALAAAAVLGSGIGLAATTGTDQHELAGSLLRADALSATMLIVIGVVGTLCCLASVGYIGHELELGHTTDGGARRYGVLIGIFLSAMALAVLAANLGVVWVAIEATTVATAFLVGHRRTREALEATWKYVIICSVGIAFAFLGTVLLYFAGRHAGLGAQALDLDTLRAHATQLDHAVTRLAAALLLVGFGAKAGLFPFHTWLADAHSQAPAPVSALMSGVLLAVAFSAILRVKAIADLTLGPGYLRVSLLLTGLLTMTVAAGLLVAQRDFKRMLAYSSMENMGLLAVAAAAGAELAVAAILLHVLAHGVGKCVLFLSAGQLQSAHDSTAVDDVRGLLARAPALGSAFGVGLLVLLGFPPFAMFGSELAIARGLAGAHLGWALGVALLLVAVAFASIAANGARMLLGPAEDGVRAVPRAPNAVRAALALGVLASVVLGVTAGPLTDLFQHAAAGLSAVGAVR
jgi:hydrogenase-4 component F